MTYDFLPVSNEICAIYNDDDVTKNPNEHTSNPNRDFIIFFYLHPISLKTVGDFVVYLKKRLPGKEFYQDLHSTSRHRVPMIFVLFFPFEDKMWGVAIMKDFTVTAKASENTRTRVSLSEY
jgi:hypothetical protein